MSQQVSSKHFKYPSYFPDSVLIAATEAACDLRFENKSAVARAVAERVEMDVDNITDATEKENTLAAIHALKGTNGGYYIANIIIEQLDCARQDVILPQIKRAFNRSSLAIPLSGTPEGKEEIYRAELGD